VDAFGECALCGAVYDTYGNNPDPLGNPDDYGQRVCTDCNERFVIPARLGQISAARVKWLRLLIAER
jgi:hypothetical protein